MAISVWRHAYFDDGYAKERLKAEILTEAITKKSEAMSPT
jgi:hypothetical protein